MRSSRPTPASFPAARVSGGITTIITSPRSAARTSAPRGWRFACDNPVEFERTLFNGARFIHAQLFGRPLLPVCTNRPPLRARRAALRVVHPLLGTVGPSAARSAGLAARMAASDPDYFRPIPSKSFPEPDDPRGPMDIRGNGQWVFQPDLAAKDWRESLYDDSGLARRRRTPAGPSSIRPRPGSRRTPSSRFPPPT